MSIRCEIRAIIMSGMLILTNKLRSRRVQERHDYNSNIGLSYSYNIKK